MNGRETRDSRRLHSKKTTSSFFSSSTSSLTDSSSSYSSWCSVVLLHVFVKGSAAICPRTSKILRLFTGSSSIFKFHVFYGSRVCFHVSQFGSRSTLSAFLQLTVRLSGLFQLVTRCSACYMCDLLHVSQQVSDKSDKSVSASF